MVLSSRPWEAVLANLAVSKGLYMRENDRPTSEISVGPVEEGSCVRLKDWCITLL